jgi:hypothetical protein
MFVLARGHFQRWGKTHFSKISNLCCVIVLDDATILID